MPNAAGGGGGGRGVEEEEGGARRRPEEPLHSSWFFGVFNQRDMAPARLGLDKGGGGGVVAIPTAGVHF